MVVYWWFLVLMVVVIMTLGGIGDGDWARSLPPLRQAWSGAGGWAAAVLPPDPLVLMRSCMQQAEAQGQVGVPAELLVGHP